MVPRQFNSFSKLRTGMFLYDVAITRELIQLNPHINPAWIIVRMFTCVADNRVRIRKPLPTRRRKFNLV